MKCCFSFSRIIAFVIPVTEWNYRNTSTHASFENSTFIPMMHLVKWKPQVNTIFYTCSDTEHYWAVVWKIALLQLLLQGQKVILLLPGLTQQSQHCLHLPGAEQHMMQHFVHPRFSLTLEGTCRIKGTIHKNIFSHALIHWFSPWSRHTTSAASLNASQLSSITSSSCWLACLSTLCISSMLSYVKQNLK